MKYAISGREHEMKDGSLYRVEVGAESFIGIAASWGEFQYVITLSPISDMTDAPDHIKRASVSNECLCLDELGYEWLLNPKDAVLESRTGDLPGDVIIEGEDMALCFRHSKTKVGYVNIKTGEVQKRNDRSRWRYRKWRIVRRVLGEAEVLAEFPYLSQKS